MRINADIAAATRPCANVDIANENIAASQSRVDDPDVAAAMAEFACDLIRHRVEGAVSGDADATPRTFLRLPG
jgi:flagellin-like hook-associated protein FlgL